MNCRYQLANFQGAFTESASGWHVNTDIAPLDMDEVKAVVEKDEQGKRSKALWEAYKIAAEGHDLKHFKEVLAEHEQYAREIAEEKAARDAEKAEKAAKKAERAEKAATKGEKAAKRKSKGAADGEEEEEEDVDMEDAEDDEAPKKAKGSKKRKKDADSDGETAKVSTRLASRAPAKRLTDTQPAKTPKIKVNGPKTPATDSAKPKKTKPAKKAKEEVAEAEPEKEEEPELSPEEKLAKREKGGKSTVQDHRSCVSNARKCCICGISYRRAWLLARSLQRRTRCLPWQSTSRRLSNTRNSRLPLSRTPRSTRC